MKHSLHQFIATVSLKAGGEPVDIHYDSLQCIEHGFWFMRCDGSGTYFRGGLVDEMRVVKAAPLAAAGVA